MWASTIYFQFGFDFSILSLPPSWRGGIWGFPREYSPELDWSRRTSRAVQAGSASGVGGARGESIGERRRRPGIDAGGGSSRGSWLEDATELRAGGRERRRSVGRRPSRGRVVGEKR
uniref:Uncharacterized protein n=1 Tax=Physcomitrium patens TaxID=3218 RepID=A0A2K1ISQ6_PHYPA|nr:hypothetical protein PHYPA_026435 [Physcomitrium patens]